MTEDVSEGIAYIYTTSGLVAEVQQNGQPLVKFFYNDRNHRMRKETYFLGNLIYTTHYVRDVARQVMAVYSDVGGNLALAEQPVYGSGRIGVAYANGNNAMTYVYELTDHLGNVRAVFTKNGNNVVMEGYADFYPGGMAMPGRNIIGDYRYDYQGQFSEKDEETGLNFFERRLYDARIMRWLRPDDVRRTSQSPYMAMGNNPILYGDPDGRDIIILNSSMAVAGLGHMAVLIGNDKDGWRYYSKNGTAAHSLYGASDSPNDGTGAYGPDNLSGNDFRKTGLTASQVMRIVNNRYMEDHPDGERYDNYIRVSTITQQDELAAEAAYAQVYSYYSVSPGLYNNGDDCGGSCLDVAQDALKATGKNFTKPNFGNILPNEWFINFGWYNNNRMYNLMPRPLTPSVEVGQGHFGTPVND